MLQVAEDRLVNMVLKELFAAEGNELYIRKAADYVFPGEELSFYEVQARCRHRREVCAPPLPHSAPPQAPLPPPPAARSAAGSGRARVGERGAVARLQVMIGVRNGDSKPLINPPDKGVRRRWEQGDCLVVLGEYILQK